MSEDFCAFEQLRWLEHVDPLLSHRIAMWQRDGRDRLPYFVKVLLELADRQWRPLRPIEPFRLTEAHRAILAGALELLGITPNDLADPVQLRRAEDVFYAITCIKPIRVDCPNNDAILPLTWRVMMEGFDLLKPDLQAFLKQLAQENGVPLPDAHTTADEPEVDEPATVEPIWFGAPEPEELPRHKRVRIRRRTTRNARQPAHVAHHTTPNSRNQAWFRTRRLSRAGMDAPSHTAAPRSLHRHALREHATLDGSAIVLAYRSGTRPGPGYWGKRVRRTLVGVGRGPPWRGPGADRSLACGVALCGRSER